MAVVFKKTVSYFKTTLAQGMTDSQTTMSLTAVPAGVIEYPCEIQIEPGSSNHETVYAPSAPSGTSYSGIVRGLTTNTAAVTAGTGTGHVANVEVVIAFTHRQWNDVVDVMTGTQGTGSNNFRVGDGTDSSIKIYAQNADTNKPFVQYDPTTNKWLISNDGVNTYDPEAGGSGVTAGQGISITAGVVSTKLNSGSGLVKNLGSGTDEMGIDATIVAKLGTANTWTAVQTFTADQLQITTAPDSANDGVNKTYADARYVNIFGDGSDGDVTLGSNTTLSRDMYYNNLTMPSTYTIDTAGYKIFVKGTLTRSGTGKIFNNGGAATAGANALGSTGGAKGSKGTGAPGVTVPSGLDGVDGVNGSSSVTAVASGNAGVAGTALSPALNSTSGANGGAGGSPGAGSGSGGAAGAGGASTVTKALPRNVVRVMSLYETSGTTITMLRTMAAGGSGGTGGIHSTGAACASGGSGASGGGGGIVWVAACFIVDSGSGTMFQAKGGAGGAGGAPSDGGAPTSSGGSGGGAGGSGGIIFRIYKTLTGTGTTDVTGGAGGAGGAAGSSPGVAGAAGSTGASGTVYDIVV